MANAHYLTPIDSFDVNDMIFKVKKQEKGKMTIGYKVIILHSSDGGATVSGLNIETDKVYTYGTSPNYSMEDETKLTGYQLPLCLTNMDRPTEYQLQFIECLNKISEKCRDWLYEHRLEFGRAGLHKSDVRDVNIVYRKKENGVPNPSAAPMLYAKLLTDYKDKSNILTEFTDWDTDLPINPLTVSRQTVQAAVQIESIWIGAKTYSIQVKLTEVRVCPAFERQKLLVGKRDRQEEDDGDQEPQDNSEGNQDNATVTQNPLQENRWWLVQDWLFWRKIARRRFFRSKTQWRPNLKFQLQGDQCQNQRVEQTDIRHKLYQ